MWVPIFFISLSYILVLSFGRYRYLPSVKYIPVYDPDPESRMEKFVSGIRDKHPGSATLVQYHGTPLKKEVKIISVSTPTKVFV